MGKRRGLIANQKAVNFVDLLRPSRHRRPSDFAHATMASQAESGRDTLSGAA